MARAGAVDQVILALPAEAPAITSVIRHCAALPVDIRVARHGRGGRETRLGAWTLAHVLDPPVAGWTGLAKRAVDLLLGGVLLAAFALPMALLTVAIRLDSPGPVLFRQRRVGFQGRVFEMLKFRTMHHEPAQAPGCVQAVRDDPRVTRLGAFLRRTSLDELPQLFNVLRGEMSLVGPRPHAPGTSADGRVFEEVVPFYAGRHRVKPGITGLAQVRGLRGETRTEADVLARVEADYEYIARWSLGLDLLILLRTALAVLSMRNAY
jgi:exopolysaccharide biosynthesis polyprenyl glycosylphosphotransferase